jgi:broad specificity phosphatase PhoE
MYLYLMRHGETDYNRAGLVQGQIDIPLNASGCAQSQTAAEYFKTRGIRFGDVYVSPLSRAWKTAEIVTGRGREAFTTDERLKEMGFGVFEGTPFRNSPGSFASLVEAPELYLPPEGGESLDQLKLRCLSFLKEMAKKYEDAPEDTRVLAATHGAAIRGFMNIMRREPVSAFWYRGLENCCCVRARLNNGRFIPEAIEHTVAGATDL